MTMGNKKDAGLNKKAMSAHSGKRQTLEEILATELRTSLSYYVASKTFLFGMASKEINFS